MATHAAPLFDASLHARRLIADYRAHVHNGDVLAQSDDPAWTAMFEELASVASDDLGHARERVQRHAADIGTGFRIIGEADERPWPVSPVPLLIEADEWAGIARGVVQRAELMETILADLYGPARFVERGLIPAALVAGNPYFLRPMVGLEPPGGCHLQFVAVDLGRGPTGEWFVLADHLRAPAGAGYALENRLALARTLGGLQDRLNIQRHAPFFAAFREGLAALCRRSDPRIGLLTPGRYNQTYPEQAHLARYLGLLLVEGDDLAALEDKLYVRTIGGLKRIDAIWRRVDPRMLDPLAFDTRSHIGVPGLIDAYAAGNVVISNAPGAGVLEAPAFGAFLPMLAKRLLGEDLYLPNIATWWCGQPGEAARVAEDFDALLIGPAFGATPLGLPGNRPVPGAEITGAARDTLIADMARRPQGLCRPGDRPPVDDARRRGGRAGRAALHLARLRGARRGWQMDRPARRLRADRRASRSARGGDARRAVVGGCLHPRYRHGRAGVAAPASTSLQVRRKSGYAAQPGRGQSLLAGPLSRARRGAAGGDPGVAGQFDRRRWRRGDGGRYRRAARRADRRRGRGAASAVAPPRRSPGVRAHRDGGSGV